MKINKKRLLKYLKKLSEKYLKEAEIAAKDGDYELAYQEEIISRFVRHYLIDSIDIDFKEKEAKKLI